MDNEINIFGNNVVGVSCMTYEESEFYQRDKKIQSTIKFFIIILLILIISSIVIIKNKRKNKKEKQNEHNENKIN